MPAFSFLPPSMKRGREGEGRGGYRNASIRSFNIPEEKRGERKGVDVVQIRSAASRKRRALKKKGREGGKGRKEGCQRPGTVVIPWIIPLLNLEKGGDKKREGGAVFFVFCTTHTGKLSRWKKGREKKGGGTKGSAKAGSHALPTGFHIDYPKGGRKTGASYYLLRDGKKEKREEGEEIRYLSKERR